MPYLHGESWERRGGEVDGERVATILEMISPRENGWCIYHRIHVWLYLPTFTIKINQMWLGIWGVATQIIFVGIFTPKIRGRWSQFDKHMFQRGWFNHQPDEYVPKKGTISEGHFESFSDEFLGEFGICVLIYKMGPVTSYTGWNKPYKWPEIKG